MLSGIVLTTALFIDTLSVVLLNVVWLSVILPGVAALGRVCDDVPDDA